MLKNNNFLIIKNLIEFLCDCDIELLRDWYVVDRINTNYTILS